MNPNPINGKNPLEGKLKGIKTSDPTRPRFKPQEWGSDTHLDLCQTFLGPISDALSTIATEHYDVSLFTGAVALTDLFLKKINVTLANPDSTVEVNGEALQLLATILRNYLDLLTGFSLHPAYSLCSRSRRYVLSSLTILLRQESRGAGEKNESPWTPAEKREAQQAALDDLMIVEARQLWAKIQCADLALVPWDHFFKLFEKTLQLSISPQDEAILKKLMTKTGVDYIRPSDFSNFLKAFDYGNLSPACVSNAKQTWFSSGFYPWCSCYDAVKFLRFEPVGSYVLTLSGRARSYFELHVVTAEGKVSTWWIRVDMPNGIYVIPSDKSKEPEAFYKSLATFFHQCNAVSPFISESLSEEGFHGDLTPEEISSLLADAPNGNGYNQDFRLIELGTYVIFYDASKIEEEDVSNPIKNFLTVSFKYQDKLLSMPIERAQAGFRFPETKRKGRSNSARALKASSQEYQPSMGCLLQTRRDILKYNFSFDNIPNFSILPYLNTAITIDLIGPEKEREGVLLSYRSNICAETIGGYPSGSLGSMLCDRFHVRCLGDRTIFALADGCNWGQRARAAATKASLGFIEYMSDPKIQSESTTLATLRDHTLRSFRIAHAKIVGETLIDDIWTVGQTTLLCGIMVPLLNNKAYRWGVLFFSVGDCKLFLFNESTGVRDLTYGNRANARDAKDTGGRLGPYVDGGQPDLRNLKSFFWPLKTGDTFFAVSDGVYDNLDPETLGSTPEQLKIPFPSWDVIPPDVCLAIKDVFTVRGMNDIAYRVKQRTPYFLARALLKHGMQVTSKSREFMEANPNTPEPSNHKDFPGKMDHITAIVIRAGTMIEDDIKKSAKERKKNLKEAKTREALIRKLKERPDEFIAFLKKNIKATVPKVPLTGKPVKGQVAEPVVNNQKSYTLKSDPTFWNTSRSPGGSAAGIHISNLPEGFPSDPLTEYFMIDSTPKRTVAAFACSTMFGSPEPATKTVETFVGHTLKLYDSCKDTIELSEVLVDSIDQAHKSLVQAPIYSSENAVLAGCVCFKHPDEYALKTGKTWTALICNIGNCRVYYWDYLKFQLTELTDNPTHDISCLGPSGSSDESPNFFNLSFFSQLCDPRGIILALSPGVASSFDPYLLGLKTEDHYTTCEEVEENTRLFRMEKLTKLLKKARPASVSSHAAVILEYVSKRSQKYLEFDNGGEDVERPGAYFGQSSVMAFRVGPFQEEPLDEKKKELEPPRAVRSPRLEKTRSEKSRSTGELRKLKIDRDKQYIPGDDQKAQTARERHKSHTTSDVDRPSTERLTKDHERKKGPRKALTVEEIPSKKCPRPKESSNSPKDSNEKNDKTDKHKEDKPKDVKSKEEVN